MSSAAEEELIERVIEVTGASEAEAKHLLGACGNDAAAAITLYYEQGPINVDVECGSGDGSIVEPPSAATVVDDSEDDRRTPILPVREQLIGPENDNFIHTMTSSGRLERIGPAMRVCPLRDFAREGALMEQQMEAAALADRNGVPSNSQLGRHVLQAGGIHVAPPTVAIAASSRLGDLYRPPTDIAYAGTFQTARKRATALKKWLLVDVQSDNFESQLLNRDVWSDRQMRKLIRRQFMLWQVSTDSVEGHRFVAFYHCAKLPYVCVVDPRTGEEVWKSLEPKQSNLLPDLRKFLLDHKDFSQNLEDAAPSTSKRAKDKPIGDSDCELVQESAKKRSRLVDLTEEEQFARAVKISMRESGVKANDENNDDEVLSINSTEEFGEDLSKKTCDHERDSSYEAQLGAAKDDLTILKLRLRNAQEADEVVELRWPSDTRLEVLRLYIAQRHGHIPKNGYRLICAFPRKSLEAEQDARSLKDLGLHPSANLHLMQENPIGSA